MGPLTKNLPPVNRPSTAKSGPSILAFILVRSGAYLPMKEHQKPTKECVVRCFAEAVHLIELASNSGRLSPEIERARKSLDVPIPSLIRSIVMADG